jgi:outer membrane protein W
MKKVLVLIFAFLCIIVFNAQAQIDVGATIGLQIPTGSFGDGAKTGFGINLVGKYNLNSNIALGLNLGDQFFGMKDTGISGLSASASIVPITGLFEYHFGSGKVKPYLGADLGLYIVTAKAKYQGQTSSSTKTYFGFAPVGGILYGINEKLSFCANLKYTDVLSEVDSTTWLGINVGIIYKIE